MSTQPAQSMPRSWHKAWKNVTVSFKNYLMSEWMNPWKTIPLGPEHLTAKPYITLSSWITYCLSQYSKSLSHGVQTISCHEMHRGNAQINLSSSSALIFKRRESYTSLWDAVLTPTSKKEKSHYLNDWLSEMKWLDFNGTVCSHPGPEGKRAERRSPGWDASTQWDGNWSFPKDEHQRGSPWPKEGPFLLSPSWGCICCFWNLRENDTDRNVFLVSSTSWSSY